MGTWGTGPFENDAAADWAATLAETASGDRAELLRRTLESVFPTAPTGGPGDEEFGEDEALAAAAVVAAVLPGGPPVHATYGPAADVTAALRVDETLRRLALRAVSAATSPESEWHDVWSEVGLLDEARAAVEPVVTALRAT